MENASKALLIAGSVLIVILLIAMGVRVFTSTSGTTDATEQTMKSTEIAQFNSKFTQYVGNNKSYGQVRALFDLISAHNSTSPKKISLSVGKASGSLQGFTLPKDSGNLQNTMNNLNGTTFSIFIGDSSYDKDGFVNWIIVRKQS